MLAVLEILEEKLSRDVAVRLLKIVNIVRHPLELVYIYAPD